MKATNILCNKEIEEAKVAYGRQFGSLPSLAYDSVFGANDNDTPLNALV